MHVWVSWILKCKSRAVSCLCERVILNILDTRWMLRFPGSEHFLCHDWLLKGLRAPVWSYRVTLLDDCSYFIFHTLLSIFFFFRQVHWGYPCELGDSWHKAIAVRFKGEMRNVPWGVLYSQPREVCNNSLWLLNFWWPCPEINLHLLRSFYSKSNKTGLKKVVLCSFSFLPT